MSKELFERKIKDLTDDKLIELLRLSTGNKLIRALASEEAHRRNLEDQFVDIPDSLSGHQKTGDQEKLKKWNWGAFLLGPIWVLANQLQKWAVVCFIPGLNLIAQIYLGYRGNKLAYEKSDVAHVDDFMVIQKKWSAMAIRLFWLGIALWLFFGFVAT